MRAFWSILLLGAVASCRSDVTAADAEDALAQDSTLVLEVLHARGDTAPVIGEVDASIDLRPTAEEIREATRSVAPPAVRKAAADPTTARIVLPRATPPEARVAAAPVVPAASAARVAEPRPPRRVASAPSGSTISFSAGKRICVNTSRIGDRFVARVNQSVRGSGGTVIRAGSRASGVVAGLTGSLGEEDLRVDITSVTVGGESRPIDARVVAIQLDRRAGSERCIPEGGNITARLTSPVRVSGNF